VTGRVRSETWTDRNTGEERSGVVIQVEEWSLAGQPRNAATAPTSSPAPAAPAWSTSGPISDEDVPF
jgi:single-stranded DNA-binding protein